MLKRLLSKLVHWGARKTDPDTSHAAAAIDKTTIEQKVLNVIQSYWGPELEQEGWTGHEIAKAIEKPINSVTPRFAPLVLKGKIKDSGVRRNGQIVWQEI